MAERNWTGELDGYLRERFAASCAHAGQPVPFSGLRINPPLETDESKYFLLGLEAELFQLDDGGNVRSELLPPAGQEQGSCSLFRLDPAPPRFFRETVCQLSTMSLLILKRGWLKSHVLLQPSVREHASLAGGAYILVRTPTNELLICVEVKRNAAELQKLIMDLRTCCNRGPHAREDCGFPQNHPTYEFCTACRPLYFWGVAPGTDICLQMSYEKNAIEVEQLQSLPPRSLMELNEFL